MRSLWPCPKASETSSKEISRNICRCLFRLLRNRPIGAEDNCTKRMASVEPRKRPAPHEHNPVKPLQDQKIPGYNMKANGHHEESKTLLVEHVHETQTGKQNQTNLRWGSGIR